ncbi:MAG: type II secretion system protein GspG, partial [Planctomycetota bacterium]
EEQGKYPAGLPDLKKKPKTAKPWPEGGYFKEDLTDGWKRMLRYRTPGTGAEFDLFSHGADNSPGGADANADLWNHEKWQAAMVDGTKAAIEKTVEAVRKFHADQGKYPERLTDLTKKEKPEGAETWPEGGYLKEPPKDGFENLLEYFPPGGEGKPFEVISRGLDRKAGGEGIDADISNIEKKPEEKPEEEPGEKPEEKPEGEGGGE